LSRSTAKRSDLGWLSPSLRSKNSCVTPPSLLHRRADIPPLQIQALSEKDSRARMAALVDVVDRFPDEMTNDGRIDLAY